MISILIPIFNFDIRPLAVELYRQCESCRVEFELVCFDDGSATQFKVLNRELEAFEKLTYRELPENLGRSAVRNALGRAARFPWLLFMDCDSRVLRSDYIAKYLGNLQADSLLYGGRSYSPAPPEESALFFHWLYGRCREQRPPRWRMQSPYHSFMTNNFLIPRDLFLEIRFDESLRQYGHEDTLFGLELERRHIPILHIDNPLEHIGLEPAAVFLKKTRQGLENLHRLWQQGKPIETRLLTVFLKIKKWKLAPLLRLAFSLSEKWVERLLMSDAPNLRLFDFYKLGYFACLDGE